jgi:3-hydroxyacyl-[acyl-carrier-protein] dehydratase
MRFQLLDRIVGFDGGRTLRTVKHLTLGEEYLADHFPTFPVMPGVLMLEALVQSAAWLLRIKDDFRHSVIVLREAKGIKYGSFVEPGRKLELTVELGEESGELVSFKGKGEVNGTATVSAKLTIGRYNLRDLNPAWQARDDRLVKHFRELAVELGVDRLVGQ